MRVGAARKEERHEGVRVRERQEGREESKREIKGDYLPMRQESSIGVGSLAL